MDLEKTGHILKKLNRLYELVSVIGEVNATEKDLMKAYILDLYANIAIPEEDTGSASDKEMRKKIKKQKKQEKKIRKAVGIDPEPEVDPGKIEQASAVTSQKHDAVEALSTSGADPAPVASPEHAISETEPVLEQVDDSSHSEKDGLSELFKAQEARELSDKLRLTPIADLTKAMSINERILTINDLFGGNKDEFENMLTALNGLESYEEASGILAKSVAVKYNWTAEEKLVKARNFITLVQRRYNHN